MRVPIEWLKEYVNIDISATELAQRLTMSGIAVEEIEDQAAQYQGMAIARIKSLEPHPQSQNLQISQLDVGQFGQKQVITAAKNVAVGDLIPVALPGCTLPDGKLIEDMNFKGVLSQGMMCSGEELGLEKESAGIWIFEPNSLTPGTTVAEALGATDQILILELTANRSDCLGIIGVAREVAAILGGEVKLPLVTLSEQGAAIEQLAGVKIIDEDLCPRYAARVATGVKIEPSPEWMQRRLKAAGIRPISNLVDITNYVMLEWNQPLHAFDLDQIAEHQVIIRRAKAGEKLLTLDDIERELVPEDLLIADSSGPLCVAGVMGGQTSEVTDTTANILLESAYFNPGSIRKTGKMLGMRTEASLRFERGIDPNGTVYALNRAAQLVEQLGMGKVAQGLIDQYPQPIQPKRIETTIERINGLLGLELSDTQIREYLSQVHLQVSGQDEQLVVEVPTFRQDITMMADLAEEVARLHGYDRIPVTLSASKQAGERSPFQKLQLELRRLLQGMGLSEVMSYSFYSRNIPKRLGLPETDILTKTVDLTIPLSEEQAVMRTNLAHGLLEALGFNAKRRQSNLAVYEIGRVYWPVAGESLPEEPVHLGIALMGNKYEAGWNQPVAEIDFYDLKGMLELLFAKFGWTEYQLKPSAKTFLHPGQSAEVVVGGRSIGYFGGVHPAVVEEYELTKKAFLLELDLTALEQTRAKSVVFTQLPKYPAIERDLALVLAADIPAASVIKKITEISGGLVEKVELFDVYQGEQVAAGQRSLAFSISYRSKERTLSDVEVNQIQAELLQQLKTQYGAVVRG